jgi:MazG family protein
MPDPSDPRHRIPAPLAAGPSAGAEFVRLLEIMRCLRSPDGCPWDREQDWKSLVPYVLEEAYEVVDAIEQDEVDALPGEIGDLVFETVFLAQVAEDGGHFTMADALRAVCEKLIRRHPHVFVQPDDAARTDGRGVNTSVAVKEQWEEIKARERRLAGKERTSVLDGIPSALPALSRAHHLGARAAKAGFDWPDAVAVLDKVEEEIAELRAELSGGRTEGAAEEIGDLLFAVAQLARKAGIDPEAAARAADDKFTRRFQAMEREVAAAGRVVTDVTIDELEAIWQRLKRRPTP